VVTGGEDSCVNVWLVERGGSSTGMEQMGDDPEGMDIDEPMGSPVRGSKRWRDGDGEAVEPPETTKRIKSVSCSIESNRN
jgi:hypothetical protein